jgi:hypothetical protein
MFLQPLWSHIVFFFSAWKCYLHEHGSLVMHDFKQTFLLAVNRHYREPIAVPVATLVIRSVMGYLEEGTASVSFSPNKDDYYYYRRLGLLQSSLRLKKEFVFFISYILLLKLKKITPFEKPSTSKFFLNSGCRARLRP